MSKYTPENLIPLLRHFTQARREALELGLSDNGGAIHSVERIANILGLRVKYPGLTHQNKIKHYSKAEFSRAALENYKKGLPVQIEHVAPTRAWSRAICDMIESNCTDQELLEFVKKTYRLVLLTKEEQRQVDSRNRSKMAADRLAGIEVLRK